MPNSELTATAVRFGTMETTRGHEFHQYAVYGEPDQPMRMDYYFWVIRDGTDTVLVDSGYHPGSLKTRPGRECIIPPVEALRTIGVDPDTVSKVIVTHFHYDHIGNLAAFKNARFVVQEHELAYWTGPHAHHPVVAATVEELEIQFIVDAARQGRVDIINGDTHVTPNIRARLAPGHCPGQQVVELATAIPVMLCSDALHFYEEMERDRPWNVFFDLEAMFKTYSWLRAFEAEGGIVVAGHDPAVMERFQALPGQEGLAVQLTPALLESGPSAGPSLR